jgi:Family of unknown function (DUF5677)
MTPRHAKRKRPAGKGKAVVRQRPRAKAPTTRQVRAQIKRLENWINGLEMIPATQIYRSKVILPLFSKALTVSRAICVLVDKGFPAEAFGLSRTLVDMFFCVRYMSNKDTDARMTTYVEYKIPLEFVRPLVIPKTAPRLRGRLLHPRLLARWVQIPDLSA